MLWRFDMKIEGINNFLSVNFENLKVVRPVEVLSKEEVEFFEKLFPENVEEIRKYCYYNSQGRQVYETGKIINKKI
jgi:hypothetical protein